MHPLVYLAAQEALALPRKSRNPAKAGARIRIADPFVTRTSAAPAAPKRNEHFAFRRGFFAS